MAQAQLSLNLDIKHDASLSDFSGPGWMSIIDAVRQLHEAFAPVELDEILVHVLDEVLLGRHASPLLRRVRAECGGPEVSGCRESASHQRSAWLEHNFRSAPVKDRSLYVW